jgi:hypothetical protein
MMTTTNDELSAQTKTAIQAGEESYRATAYLIAAAQQREIAVVIGKSKSWVNRLLKWREGNFQDKIELFARQARDGGACSGNQAPAAAAEAA